MKIKLTKQKSITLTAPNIIIASIIWQIVWVLILAAFQIREKLVYAGLFGVNCNGCSTQDTVSVIGIMTPLAIGSLVFGISFISILKIKNRFLQVLLSFIAALAVLYVSYISWGIMNFALNYGS